MTATIQKPDSDGPRRDGLRRRRRVSFSSMESLGFIETPTTVSTTWGTAPPTPPPAPHPVSPRRVGAHEKMLADVAPSDTTEELVNRRVRWGMVGALVVIVAGLTAAGFWLWQRPTAIAEAATSDVTAAARALEPELNGLRDLSGTLDAADIDTQALTAGALAVDSAARALFNASAELPATAAMARSQAADTSTTALNASRLLSDAVAYRSAVVQILVPPDLEADPELIGLDDALRGFGEWQRRFNDVRSALPTGTMTVVSDELELIAGDLEGLRSRYVDGLRNDDRLAAKTALDDLAARLAEAEGLLFTSLEDVQARIDELIESGLTGIDRLVG